VAAVGLAPLRASRWLRRDHPAVCLLRLWRVPGRRAGAVVIGTPYIVASTSPRAWGRLDGQQAPLLRTWYGGRGHCTYSPAIRAMDRPPWPPSRVVQTCAPTVRSGKAHHVGRP